MDFTSVVNTILGGGLAGVGIATVVGVARWFRKVDRSLSASVHLFELVIAKLTGHEQVDETRHDGLDRRVSTLERHID